MSSSKKRVVVLGGGAHFIPSYRALLNQLTVIYDVVLLSEFHIDSEKNTDKYHIHSVPEIKMSRLKNFLFFLLVIKFILTKRVDIIHSHSTFPSGFIGIIVKKIFRVPAVVCLNAGEATAINDIQFGELLNPNRTKINRWVITNADAVTALSRSQLKEIEKYFHPKKTISQIPRGVNYEKYFFQRHLIANPVRFLNVAYIHPVKDHETLLRSFQLIVQRTAATLTIVGRDYENKKMEALAKELKIDSQVKFVGQVPHEATIEYFRNADILLHTSRYEAFPGVVAEALAAGALVCGTHVGILADLSGECCLTVAPRDFEGLSIQVQNLLQSVSLQEKLRSNGYAWAKLHSLQWTADRYRELYNNLLST